MLKQYWLNFLKIVKAAAGNNIEQSSININHRRKSTNNLFSKAIVRAHRPDYKIVMFMILLMLTGLVLIYAIGPQRVNLINRARDSNANLSQSYYFYRQIFSLLISMAAFVIVAKIPLSFWKRYGLQILIAGLLSGVLLFVLSKPPLVSLKLAQCTYGACRWLIVGNQTIQVAEIIKISLIIFLAMFWAWFCKNDQINSRSNMIYSGIISTIALTMIVIWQNDLGTGISLVMILLAMFWSSGVKPKIILVTIGILLLGSIGMIVAKPHRLARVATFIKGDSSVITDSTRHIVHAKIAVGSGGLFGLGIGKSVQATGYLPEAINDSIFAIVGEIFGFIGCLVIIGLFVGLLSRLIHNASHSYDTFNRLIIVAAAAWIFSHFVINISSMLGLMPMTGITLPFLSYGGTSMVFMATILGLAFNASKFTAHSRYVFNNSQGKN